MSLDFEQEEFQKAMAEVCSLVAQWHGQVHEQRAYPGKEPEDIQKLFKEPLPEHPTHWEEVIESVRNGVFENATLNVSPRFTAYVMSGGNQMGVLAEFLAAAVNQNVTKWHLAPAAAEMELVVLNWLATFIGYPSSAGILTSGGSQANLEAVALARQIQAPFDIKHEGLTAAPPLTFYASKEAHHCHTKTAELLGMGIRSLRKTPVRSDLTIDPTALEEQILSDRSSGYHPFCVVANAGAVNTGAIDPLNGIAEICARQKLWFHIDGAYGGPAAALPSQAEAFKGLERADSIALDPHKWLYAPFEAGCLLVRRWEELQSTFSAQAPYLAADQDRPGRTDFGMFGMQLSRSFRALKIWMAFKVYGADAFRQSIAKNLDIMQKLAADIEESSDFELLAPVPLTAVCLRYCPPRFQGDETQLDRLNHALAQAVEADGRMFVATTTVKNRTAIRACSVNHRLEPDHPELFLTVLRELGATLH